MTTEFLGLGLIWFVAFLFSTTVHEAAHALAALRLGDPTAYHGGQVTLNPAPHVQREPFGMVVVPIISYLLSGWTMGWASAPYDPQWADRYPKRAGLMALAGPASNLVVVLLAGIAIRVGLAMGTFFPPDRISFTQVASSTDPGLMAAVATFLSVLFSLNLILFAFNLLPLPPLDGSAIVPLLLNDSWAAAWKNFIYQPMMGLFGILIAWNVFPHLFSPIHLLALNLLYPGLSYG